jgi:hypothetical protein
LENTRGHQKIKEARISKAKAVQDYKLCDQLSAEIRKLLQDRAEYERQISAIEQKEKKASWYRKKSKSKVNDDKDPGSQTPKQITKLFKASLEKNVFLLKTKTTNTVGTGSVLHVPQSSSTSDTSTTTADFYAVMPTDVIEVSTDIAVVSLEHTESNSSHDTLIVHSSNNDQDF